jgi:hypothetical protein
MITVKLTQSECDTIIAALRLWQRSPAHQPSVWHFGHFHLNREFFIAETKFRCLAEMAISQVSEVFAAPEGIR